MDSQNIRARKLKLRYPDKFVPDEQMFSHIKRGDRIFLGTGCGHPQYLVKALVNYIHTHPKAFFDTELIQVWTLGLAPYLQERFQHNFRLNSFFIGKSIKSAVNEGAADYTPISLSKIPGLMRKKMIPIDVAIIQTSPPDAHGHLSLGISVDIVKTAAEQARLVIAQINSFMPRTHGNAFIHIKNVDYCLYYDEELLEFDYDKSDSASRKIGKYIARLVRDGDTIQIGYGSLCNDILASMTGKKNLGVHTEILNDGLINLIKMGVVDNSKKTIHRGKTVSAFCMGNKETYKFLDNNPKIEFHPVDYTNNPLLIAKLKNMTAINSALQVDLTGQSSSETVGTHFFGGIGGQVDFMRAAVLATGGKSILTLRSTARNGQISRIVPMLATGTGVTLNRDDIHYVVTEFGVAYIHGKNIRERAMSLIAIAHPKFQPWLIEEAKKWSFIYKDQNFISGPKGEYPEFLEVYRTVKHNLTFKLRPVRINDEPLLKEFFYSLSNKSLYRRFASARYQFSHQALQKFLIIDYTKEIVILAVQEDGDKERILGLGEYRPNANSYTAEIAFAVRDEFQNRGIGTELILYLTFLAQKQGLQGFTAEVLESNKSTLHLIDKLDYGCKRKYQAGVYKIDIDFRQTEDVYNFNFYEDK